MSWTCARAFSPDKWEQLVPTEAHEVMAEKRELRRAVMEALLDNDLLVKLRSDDGKMPYLDHPRDGIKVRDLRYQLDVPYSRIVEALRVLEWQNLAVFYTREKLRTTWFEDILSENIENFAMTSDEIRSHLYEQHDADVVREFVMKAIDEDLRHTTLIDKVWRKSRARFAC